MLRLQAFSKAPGTDLYGKHIIELSCPVGLVLFVAGRAAALPSAEDKTTLKQQKNE
ncbi:MAG: hypothetical protein M0P70_03730 [Desulfobulbaceae bacterium]|nr:hypothetical protein [Desulfobulbaceae bacterium]